MSVMKEVSDLAFELAKMGIMCASLEVDLRKLTLLEESLEEFVKENPYIYGNMNREYTDKPPGFTIQMYGVKMYFNDPKTRFENEKKNKDS